MPTEMTPRQTILALAVLILVTCLAGLAAGLLYLQRPANAQTAGPQLNPVVGAPVEFLGKVGETHTVTLSCGPGEFAVAGGWNHLGAPSFVVLDNFASQLPGLGEGRWTLTFRKVDKGSLTITPYTNCLGGISQVPA